MLSCRLILGKKDAYFVVCSSLVAPNARIMFKSLLVVLNLLTC